MISGFNTDVVCGGVTYHVQTEDKGLSRPIIVTLVYNGGTILASKRQPYDDLLKDEFDEKLLEARLHRQHKLICAAIQAGRIGDLIKLSEAQEAPVVQPAVSLPSAGSAEAAAVSFTAVPIPRPRFEPLLAPFDPGLSVVEAVDIVEDVYIPEEAVSVVSELSGQERPGSNKLKLELLTDGKFKSGERHSISVLAFRGNSGKVVPNAQVMVKVLGSAFRPLIFHTLTDANGMATVSVHLPEFMSGRAALLVRVSSAGEEVELRRAVETGRGGR